ncbi:MAG: glycosyltransferase family 2 protein [Pseudomonadota bacterium]
MAHVTALIVNYQSADLVLANVPNLTAEKQGVDRLDIVIVENGSPGDDAEVLRQGLIEQGAEDQYELIVSQTNGGFASGNNIGLRAIAERETRPDFVVLVNPDTTFFEGTIASLVNAAADHPQAGCFGGYAVTENGERRDCAYHFPGITRQAAKLLLIGRLFSDEMRRSNVLAPDDEPVVCDWVSGSCFMLRAAALEAVPLFDDGYFLYFEETDYCRRLKDAGFLTMHVPRARYVHIKGVSTGFQDDPAKKKPLPDYWYRSWRRYYVKNHGRLYALGMGMMIMLSMSLKGLSGRAQPPGGIAPRRFISLCMGPTVAGSPL